MSVRASLLHKGMSQRTTTSTRPSKDDADLPGWTDLEVIGRAEGTQANEQTRAKFDQAEHSTLWRNHVGPVTYIQHRLTDRYDARADVRWTSPRRSSTSHRFREFAPAVVSGAQQIWAHKPLRQWLREALTTIVIVGGFIAAPLLTVLAWIGMAQPDRAALHQLSTTLIIVAIVWMIVALVSAHVQQSPDSN